jgi:hypothetical protein
MSISFLMYTGARKREELVAKWTDIDWAQKSWKISKKQVQQNKTCDAVYGHH